MLVSCQPRRYYSASEQRLTAFAYLAYEGRKAQPWPESKLAQLFLGLIHWAEYVLPGYATIWRLRCLDCILIEAHDDIYHLRPSGSLKVLGLDCDILGETHSGLNVQMEVGMYLQLVWALYTFSTNWRMAPDRPEPSSGLSAERRSLKPQTTHWRRFWEAAWLSERIDTYVTYLSTMSTEFPGVQKYLQNYSSATLRNFHVYSIHYFNDIS